MRTFVMTFDLRQADCLDVLPTLADRSIDLIATDPPYSAVNNPNVTTGFRKYGPKSFDKGRTNDGESLDIPRLAAELVRVCRGSIYVWCSSEQVSAWRSAFVAARMTTRQCVWVKANPAPMNGHVCWLTGVELCVFAKRPKATFNRCCELPVWYGYTERVKGFPCPKPVWLMEQLVDASSQVGDLVFDPFMGSGTVGVACQKLGRRFLGVELHPDHFAIAQRRLVPDV
jgi:site-specific DNA-methyltransferase (adenine-specific)